jgi:hypothetical protein
MPIAHIESHRVQTRPRRTPQGARARENHTARRDLQLTVDGSGLDVLQRLFGTLLLLHGRGGNARGAREHGQGLGLPPGAAPGARGTRGHCTRAGKALGPPGRGPRGRAAAAELHHISRLLRFPLTATAGPADFARQRRANLDSTRRARRAYPVDDPSCPSSCPTPSLGWGYQGACNRCFIGSVRRRAVWGRRRRAARPSRRLGVLLLHARGAPP